MTTGTVVDLKVVKRPVPAGSGRALAVSAILALLLTASAPSASLATGPWHNSIVAYEDSGGLGYTGLRDQRSGYLMGLVLASCSWPVYDTMWVYVTTADLRWLEMGTRYVCDSSMHPYHDVFIGYGLNPSTFYWLDYTTDGTSSADHTYAIKMDYGWTNSWDYKIDGTTEWSGLLFADRSTSDQLNVVLETYDDETIVPSHSVHSFKKTRFENTTWAAWSGEDDFGDVHPPLCGYWSSSTSVQSGENVTC